MKHLIIILLILSGLVTKAQLPSGFPTQKSTGWFEQGYQMSDSATIIAERDTSWTPRFPGTIILWQNAGVDTLYWYHNGHKWNKIPITFTQSATTWGSITGTLSNQTDLQNALNLKLNITDTTNKWLTSVYRKVGSDSVFYVKGGNHTFAFKDSIGSGGSGTVTSVGLSMPSAFTVSSPNPITTSGTFSVTGAGTSLQYIRGNGTLATFDTTAIPSFSVKVRGLFSGVSPIQIDQSNGDISILDATNFQKGVASFNAADFTVSAGVVSLVNSAGEEFIDTAINVGSGIGIFKEKTSDTLIFKSLTEGYGVNLDNNTNDIGIEVDTSEIATQYDLTQIVGGITELTGDVTAGPGSGSQVATIANNAVTNAKFRQSTALSIVGNSTNGTANVADITAATDFTILRRSGTSIGFGSINLASSNAVGSSILGIANGGTGASSFTTGSVIFKGPSSLSENNSNFFWDNSNIRLGIGTNSPAFEYHVSKASPGDGTGILTMVEDTRASGNFRIAGLATRTTTMYTQLLALDGTGFSFDPFNSITGSYLRNVTADRGWYFTLNRAGTEKKAMTLTSDTTVLGYNAIIDAPEFVPSGGFGGYPVLVGSQTQGSGVAVGWKAQAKNVEATAIGPQAYADGFATIAIGDAAKARTYTWGGNIDIGGTLPPSRYGNQVVIGDAAFADSNVNFFIGGGAGLKNNFAICVGCAGSSTTYTLSATDRDHQGFLGWYDETSDYFDFAATGLGGQGVGLVNDWWLGGPVQATFPHDISFRVTSALGADKDGIDWYFHNSRSTGNASGGDYIWMGSTVGASGTALNDSIERMRLKANGNLLIGGSTDLGTSKLQVTGTIQMQDGNQASGRVLTSDANGIGTWQAPSSGLSFNNGTTNTSGTVQFGGTLVQNTTINTGGFTTEWTGSNDNETSFSVTNTGTTSASAIAGTASGTTSIGVSGTSTSYIGVLGTSTSNNAVTGQSTSGVGVVGTSTSGAALRGQINPSSTNAIENVLTLLRTSSSGGMANNGGSAIQWELETATNGTSQTAGSIAFKWTDATNATRTSQFEIYGVNSATTGRKAAIAGTGQWTWDGYGSGTFTGTPTGSLQTTSGGAIIEGPLVAYGTYTPTLTNGANVTASTAYQCQYMRVGNVVTVSGKVDIDPTSASTLTSLEISLPIASAVPNDFECAGTASSGGASNLSGGIRANTTNDTAELVATIGLTATNQGWFFTFTYLIDNS